VTVVAPLAWSRDISRRPIVSRGDDANLDIGPRSDGFEVGELDVHFDEAVLSSGMPCGEATATTVP
jgi:hypothetical protein